MWKVYKGWIKEAWKYVKPEVDVGGKI